MKVLYTDQAITSLKELQEFLQSKHGVQKASFICSKIIAQCESLRKKPLIGSKEPLLEHLNLGHRRIIVSHTKIIYRVKNQTVYITDIFDSRQEPAKMKP